MDASKFIGSGRSEQDFDEAMKALAATIREAGECLLDLQQAVLALQLANDADLSRHIDHAAEACLREAMRRK